MNRSYMALCAIAMSAGVAVGSTAGAANATQADPIAINDVSVEPAEGLAAGDSERSGSIAVTFTNGRDVVATRVELLVCSRTKLMRSITAKGTFSPGVRIRKTWLDTSLEPGQHVVLKSANFADHTHWFSAEASCKRR
jgi:hypothetical protein